MFGKKKFHILEKLRKDIMYVDSTKSFRTAQSLVFCKFYKSMNDMELKKSSGNVKLTKHWTATTLYNTFLDVAIVF